MFKFIKYKIIKKLNNEDLLVQFSEPGFKKYDSVFTDLGTFQLMSNDGYLRKIPVDESYITNLIPKETAIYRSQFRLFDDQLIAVLKGNKPLEEVKDYVNDIIPVIINWANDFNTKIEQYDKKRKV